MQMSTSPVTQVSNDSSPGLSLVSSDVEDAQYQATLESIQVRILEEFQKVNRRLDSVEEDIATVKKTMHQKRGTCTKTLTKFENPGGKTSEQGNMKVISSSQNILHTLEGN